MAAEAGNLVFDPINSDDCAKISQDEATRASINSQKSIRQKYYLVCVNQTLLLCYEICIIFEYLI